MTKIIVKPVNIGESIEEKIRKASTQKSPLEAVSPMVYTDSKLGVLPQYDVRTDRFDLALDAIDHYQASEAAKGDGMNLDKDNDLAEYKETE